jgi:RNA-directed DNA polymerase
MCDPRHTRSKMRNIHRPHRRKCHLLKAVARRIVDRRVLRLIKMWLNCPVEEADERGRKTRTTEARDHRRGIPQGSPLSPLLATIYMRRFIVGVEEARP